MDKLDIAIVRSLTAEPDIRKSFKAVAKELHLDEVTVRNRVNKLFRSGYLKRVQVLINPMILGLRFCTIRIDVLPPSSKSDAIGKIRLIEGVNNITNYFGTALNIDLYYDDEQSLKNKVELISSIANSDSVIPLPLSFPPCDTKLGMTDLRIIKSIADSPRKSYVSIATQTGLSPKTVRRRLQRLISSKTLFLAPNINFRALRGVLRSDLFALYDSPQVKHEVDEKVLSILGDRLFMPHLGESTFGFYSSMLTNISEGKEILMEVKRINGVQEAYLDLIEERVELYDSYQQLAEKRLIQAKA